MLGAVSVREKIGIDIKNGDLYTTLEDEEVIKPLSRIVLDLAHKRVNVSKLKSVKQMEKYIKSFSIDDRADPSRTREPTKTKKKKKKSKKTSSRRSTMPRSSVVSPSTDYSIDDARTEKIFEELKGLDVNVYPNSCSVLLRLFLEFSLVDYMRKNGHLKLKYDSGKSAGKTKNMNDMLEEVINDLVGKDLSLEADFNFLRTSITRRQSPLFVGLLHQFVHNRYFAPTPEELRTTWDNSKPLFDAIWK